MLVVRVIAGHYRGRILKSPPSMQVRPTSDRLRETLFNILAPHIEEARFLDLCSGSGAIGIEALSRGAAFVTFVDRSRKSCGLIEANLDMCEVPEDQTEVVMSEASEFLKKAHARGTEPWNIVFVDPPYAIDYLPILHLVGTHSKSLLKDEGMLIVEHHHKNELKETIGELRRWRIVRQGDSSLSFYLAE
jgi:16S rRNA (guanine966-N2)-methyltransferase